MTGDGYENLGLSDGLCTVLAAAATALMVTLYVIGGLA